MSTFTPNYGLEKPDSTDYYDVNVQNGNLEKIDSALKNIDDKKADLGDDGKIPTGQLPELAYDAAGSAAEVQNNLDAHISNKKNPHGVTAAQVGAYKKEEVMTTETSALFGLRSDAVPNDALRLLGRFHAGLGNEYLWGKYEAEFVEQLGNEVSKNGAFKGYSFQYADSVSYQNGKVVLNNPTSATIPGVTASGEDGYHKYIICNQIVGNDDVVYVTSVTGSGSTHYYKYRPVSFVKTTGPLADYLNAPNQSAYPPEEPDDYIYVPLGKLGGFSHIISGSYTGTGESGSENANKIEFQSPPKIVFIVGGLSLIESISPRYGILFKPPSENTSPVGFTFAGSGNVDAGRSINPTQLLGQFTGNIVSWYGGNEKNQLNESEVVYDYRALF